MDKHNNTKPTTFDHLFGPNTSSSSSSAIFTSIFPPPPVVGGRDSRNQDVGVGRKNYGAPGNHNNMRGEKNSNDQNETVEPNYYSSSIYYGGQENYSPRTRTTDQPHPIFKKDKDDDDDPNDNNSNTAARGNWWQGSLYY